MFFIIYEVTNIVNQKKYIGKHQTKNLDDGYLGSGIILKKAIKKYGVENFVKNILFVFDNEEQMNAKEIELVTEEIVSDKKYYNISLGGNGGKLVLYKEHPDYDKNIEKIKVAQKKRSKELSIQAKKMHLEKRIGMYGKTQTEKQKQAVSKKLKGVKKSVDHVNKQRKSMQDFVKRKDYINSMSGKKHRPESIEKMRQARKQTPKILCVCGKLVDTGNFKRWHSMCIN